MRKRIYISADYSIDHGDRDVVECLNKWGNDHKHILDFVDMSRVISGSVEHSNPDCRPCDLKQEFNRQIYKSSIVVFFVGDKTAVRKAGSSCKRMDGSPCDCTPYKKNTNGMKACKVVSTMPTNGTFIGEINSYSYLQHEFKAAKLWNKKIVILYNSSRMEKQWLPTYMRGYENIAKPFWTINFMGERVADYASIKKLLGYC